MKTYSVTKTFIWLGLLAATLATYLQVGSHSFINLDDYLYVTENPQVIAGLSWSSVRWAFTTFTASNWHPLTWLSHMADVELYGLSPRGHHLTNVVLHLLNTSLLLYFLNRVTGSFGRSFLVAGLFALHPLHVESVAWVAERKDMLGGLFWMLTLLTYARYVERPGVMRYLLILLTFTVGLLAKPMIVTLPCVLLLLDFWPLRRSINGILPAIRPLLIEKVPFFVLAAASSVVTYLAQEHGGSVTPVDSISLSLRLANALTSYVAYLYKMVWPSPLAVYYPFPQTIPFWQTIGAIIILSAITWWTVHSALRYPWVIVGWLWFLGTLLPVIGLVQVGRQALADRYTYLPAIGVFIIIAWGFPELLHRWRFPRWLGPLSAGLALTGCQMLTWHQLGYWQNSVSLFRHTIAVTENNELAQNNLGNALCEEQKYDEAIPHLLEALRINPRSPETYFTLGNINFLEHDYTTAVMNFSQAVAIKPNYGYAHYNLGASLWQVNRKREAIAHYSEALRIDPNDEQARQSLIDHQKMLSDIEFQGSELHR